MNSEEHTCSELSKKDSWNFDGAAAPKSVALKRRQQDGEKGRNSNKTKGYRLLQF